MATEVRDRILQARLVVVMRGVGAERALEAVHALVAAGLRAFEVTLDSEDALATIGALRAQLPDAVLVGAGTVLSPEEVDAAGEAGATFVVSPHFDAGIVERARDIGLTSIPGAQTATEVLGAWRAGADIVKIFPIRPLGADYVAQLRGPFADVPLMATGGVDAPLARACLKAGADVVGTGLQFLGEPGASSAALTEAGRAFLDAVREI